MNEIIIENKTFNLKVVKAVSKKTNADYYALVLTNANGYKKYVSFKLDDIAQFVGMNMIDIVKSLG